MSGWKDAFGTGGPPALRKNCGYGHDGTRLLWENEAVDFHPDFGAGGEIRFP